jgi:hypothetical protein
MKLSSWTRFLGTLTVVPLLASTLSCVTHPYRPCSEGGQPAHESGVPFRGIKRCYQIKNEEGKYVNDGQYFEWYPNDKIETIGQYKNGKKVGRWTEFDEEGNKVSEKIFHDGKEVSAP